MRRPPGVRMVRPGVDAGLDRHEPVPALRRRSGQRPAPEKFGSSGASCVSTAWRYRPAAFACQISISWPRSGFPSLPRTRPSRTIRCPSGSPACCRVRSASRRLDRRLAVRGPGQLRLGPREDHERLLRRTEPGADVVGVVVRRVDARRAWRRRPRRSAAHRAAWLSSSATTNGASVTSFTSSTVAPPSSSVRRSSPSTSPEDRELRDDHVRRRPPPSAGSSTRPRPSARRATTSRSSSRSRDGRRRRGPSRRRRRARPCPARPSSRCPRRRSPRARPSTATSMWPPRIIAKLWALSKYAAPGSAVIGSFAASMRSGSCSSPSGRGPDAEKPVLGVQDDARVRAEEPGDEVRDADAEVHDLAGTQLARGARRDPGLDVVRHAAATRRST